MPSEVGRCVGKPCSCFVSHARDEYTFYKKRDVSTVTVGEGAKKESTAHNTNTVQEVVKKDSEGEG